MPEVMIYSRKLSAAEMEEMERDMASRGLSREFAMTDSGGTVVLGLDKEKMGRFGRMQGDPNLKPFYQLYWGSNGDTTIWQLTVMQGDRESMSACGAYPAVEKQPEPRVKPSGPVMEMTEPYGLKEGEMHK